jgi:hypothetical protein
LWNLVIIVSWGDQVYVLSYHHFFHCLVRTAMLTLFLEHATVAVTDPHVS